MGKYDRARRFFKSPYLDKHYEEFKEQTWEVMDAYLEKYGRRTSIMIEDVVQTHIRIWLKCKNDWENWGGSVSEELHDFAIKYILGIVPRQIDLYDARRIIMRFEPKYQSISQTIALDLFSLPPGTTLASLRAWLKHPPSIDEILH